MVLGSKWALTRAQENVERSFPVVGFLEDLAITFKVLEAAVPEFFEEITNVYQVELKSETVKIGTIIVMVIAGPRTNKNGKKKNASNTAKRLLGTNLTVEYDFYHFVKQRLYTQYNQIYNVD